MWSRVACNYVIAVMLGLGLTWERACGHKFRMTSISHNNLCHLNFKGQFSQSNFWKWRLFVPLDNHVKIKREFKQNVKIGIKFTMGEEHNVVFGQGPKVNKAKSTPTSPSICLMRHIEEEVSVLLALLTLGPCPKTTLCSSPIENWPTCAHHCSKNFIPSFPSLRYSMSTLIVNSVQSNEFV